VAGGLLAGDVSTDRVVRVDLGSGAVRAMAPLAVPVHDVAGGLAGGTPLVVGGGNATEQDVVQALGPGGWSVVGHLPTSRSDLSTVALRRSVLVVGGYDGVGTPTGVLSLGADGTASPHGRWSTAPWTLARSDHCCDGRDERGFSDWASNVTALEWGNAR